MAGTYEEQLPDGGKLRVWSEGWQIYYYVPGPDWRYKGTHIRIEEGEIPKLIEAYKQAFQRYEQLRASIPEGGTLEVRAERGLTIRVGGYAAGVCMETYMLCVSTRMELDRKIAVFQWAINRATQIQAMLLQIK